ncbi:MAG: undecaprenyldiphospho-muramoylpentapeptide beta-N-acetylglucosaminyltransferase [Erysipelotrichaceae bacterium]
MKIVLVAGGSGGHIYPALELAKTFKEYGHEILFIGNKNRMEATIIPDLGYDFFAIDNSSLQGSFAKKINSLLLMHDSYTDSLEKLKSYGADCVIGFGNYVTVPVILAAKRLKIKTVIHEQNSIVGSANKLLSKVVDKVVVSYQSTLVKMPKKKSYYYGNPRSSAFKDLKYDRKILKKYGLKPDLKTVLIFMGSLGSKVINDFMLEALKNFRKKDYQVLYVTGKNYYQDFITKFNETNNVKVLSYANTNELLNNIDILVSRAGATTIAEITAIGITSLLIPSPYVVANHQYYNASNLVEKNAAVLLSEEDLTQKSFIDKIDEMIANDKYAQSLAENAKALSKIDSAELIYQLVIDLVGESNE